MVERSVIVPKTKIRRDLNEREKEILTKIIQLYILKASPVGSRTLSKYIQEELSSATIRNVMSDLEEMEFISHPHTSAGRIPTDKGYRFYVDTLEKIEALSQNELRAIEKNLCNKETVFEDASKILGILSSYLSIVSIPKFIDLKVIRLELITISTNRILVVIALDSNFVKTITLEAGFDIEDKQLDDISLYINEKVSGKPLKFIKENFKELMSDFAYKDTPIIRLFFDSIDQIFNIRKTKENIHIAGTHNLLEYPEFDKPERIKGVIEMLENEEIIIHLLDKFDESKTGIRVLIGKEMEDVQLEDYSFIVSSYKFGNADGSIGIIGPKRMPYSKMMSLVKNVSDYLTNEN
jgi:heat-inducible transcriptional repressor